MKFIELITDLVLRGASDIFIIAGKPVVCKINGKMLPTENPVIDYATCKSYIEEIYSISKRDIDKVLEMGDDDFSFSLPGISRFRVNTYKQRGSLAAVVRVVNYSLPDPKSIGIPDEVLELTDKTKGLILVTGPAGSGKSTTQACLIDRINITRENHIITLEDPIEYLHKHKKSIVSQREIECDTQSYVKALRAALRQAPDVVLLGEMRDAETMAVAMTAAETGHLVISTLHTAGAANTIDRIIDSFPGDQQQQIRVQLSLILQAVVSQQLLPTIDGKIMPVFELMLANTAICNMTRDSKVHQIDSVIQSSAHEGMIGMDSQIYSAYKDGYISAQTAVAYASNTEAMSKRLDRK